MLIAPLSAAAMDVSFIYITFERKPLFVEANLYPGTCVTRWIKAKNYLAENADLSMNAVNFSEPTGDDLSLALEIQIKEGAAVLYSGKLSDFYGAGFIDLPSLSPSQERRFDVTICFPFDKGNEWQGKTTRFDIAVNGVESGQEDEDNDDNNSGGGGGSVLSVITSSSGGGGGMVHNLTVLPETVRATNISEDSVTITWGTSLFSSSQVIYAKESEPHILDLNDTSNVPPFYGYAHTSPEYDISPTVTWHSVTLTGLTPGVTYYFRAISHASLAISTEFLFSTIAPVPLKEGNGGIGGENVSLLTPSYLPSFRPSPSGTPATPLQPSLQGQALGEETGLIIEAQEKEDKAKEDKTKENRSLLASIGLSGNWLVLVILFLICLVLLFFFYLYDRRKKKIEQDRINDLE